MGQQREVIVHRCRQHFGTVDRLNPQMKRSSCRMPSTRLDQVPRARGTGYWVEQVGPVRLPRRLVQEESIQRQTSVGHLLHDSCQRAHRCGSPTPGAARLTPGPAMGAPLVSSAGHRMVSHGCPIAFGPSLHAKGASPKVSEWSWSDVST